MEASEVCISNSSKRRFGCRALPPTPTASGTRRLTMVGWRARPSSRPYSLPPFSSPRLPSTQRSSRCNMGNPARLVPSPLSRPPAAGLASRTHPRIHRSWSGAQPAQRDGKRDLPMEDTAGGCPDFRCVELMSSPVKLQHRLALGSELGLACGAGEGRKEKKPELSRESLAEGKVLGQETKFPAAPLLISSPHVLLPSFSVPKRSPQTDSSTKQIRRFFIPHEEFRTVHPSSPSVWPRQAAAAKSSSPRGLFAIKSRVVRWIEAERERQATGC